MVFPFPVQTPLVFIAYTLKVMFIADRLRIGTEI